MEIFKVEIQEFLSRIVEIEANSIDEALDKVNQSYRNQEIVLDSNDFISNRIEAIQQQSLIDFDTLSNGDNFYMIEGKKITFWGKDIETRISIIDKDAFLYISENDIPEKEPFEFNDDIDYRIFLMLYSKNE
ncbi:DpnD/PcfM family protein [Marivirga sp.]|uniref:DpnD/PcfM family protein n=1 Tax=Marivirga sp. TaxID=2018662 RepID=UPI002D7FAF07|nr:DpnD/PcfM family protein [Marivirga sp.]HET8860207.1 DpnD/PcfM family protein [Marivirga sp.]